MIIKDKMNSLLVLTGMAVALGACTTVEGPRRDAYAAANYTGSEKLYEADKVAAFRARPQTEANGEPLQIASFAGIDGARDAHRLLVAENAEKVDGNCEQFVEVGLDETLVDISRLCDVAVGDLVDFNPSIENPYFIEVGQVVEVPFAGPNTGTVLGFASELRDLYTVQGSDSLSQIAYRYDISTASIAKLNPNVVWSDLRSGDRLRLPTDVAKVKRSTTVASTSDARWEGYDARGIPGGAGNGGGLNSVTSLMPYNLGPVQASSAGAIGTPRPRLEVGQSIVKAGGAVSVTAKGLPADSDVTFYRGDNVQDLKRYKTVRTDENGEVTISSPTSKKKSNAGGVIFKAEPENGKSVYSERVGIVKLKDPTEMKNEKSKDDK